MPVSYAGIGDSSSSHVVKEPLTDPNQISQLLIELRDCGFNKIQNKMCSFLME
jgi:hypothetical protein